MLISAFILDTDISIEFSLEDGDLEWPIIQCRLTEWRRIALPHCSENLLSQPESYRCEILLSPRMLIDHHDLPKVN